MYIYDHELIDFKNNKHKSKWNLQSETPKVLKLNSNENIAQIYTDGRFTLLVRNPKNY